MTTRTQLKVGGAALGGALLGATLSGGLGLAAYAATDCGTCEDEAEGLGSEVTVLTVTALSAAVLIPGATVLTTRLAGEASGVPGRRRWLFGGAYIGFGAGVVGTVLIAEVFRPQGDWALFATGAALTTVSVAGFTTLFHRVSVRRELALHPSVAPSAHGLSVGVAGRF